MSTTSPAEAIRKTPARTFVHVKRLPGSPTAARQAASRAARIGELVPVRRGLYYRGTKSKYGMTRPRPEDVVRELLGGEGSGPAGYSAAREWDVTTQIPSSFHVATIRKAESIDGATLHHRSNRKRALLNAKEIALLELLRAPDTFVEAGWNTLVDKVRAAATRGEIHVDRLRDVADAEWNASVRTNYARLDSTLAAA